MNISIRLSHYLRLHPGKLVDKKIKIIGYPESTVEYDAKNHKLKSVNAPRKEAEGQYTSID